MGDLPEMPQGITLLSYDCLDSTNSEALRLIASGEASDGVVIFADRQTAGRGRRDASWESPAGNLYLTLITKVFDQRQAGQLAFVASLAIRDAVINHLDDTTTISCKWPNDLLLNGQKLSGILIEAVNEFYVVGIGVNLVGVPTSISDKAISLADTGVSVGPGELLVAVVSEFQHWNNIWKDVGFSALRDAWLASAHGIDKPIVARFPDGSEDQGIFLGIDGMGALVLERGNGSTRKIAAGEIFFAD